MFYEFMLLLVVSMLSLILGVPFILFMLKGRVIVRNIPLDILSFICFTSQKLRVISLSCLCSCKGIFLRILGNTLRNEFLLMRENNL
jgi:hypothetical protein